MVVSLLVPILIAFFLASIFGPKGGSIGMLTSPVISSLIYLGSASKTHGKSNRYGLAAAISFVSLAFTSVVAMASQATVHKALSSAINATAISFYSPTVGARSRKYANKVIASVATSSNVDSLQEETAFLLTYDQSKWLSTNQMQALRKKKQLLLKIRSQKEMDIKLLGQVRSALDSPITIDSYKLIISTAREAPQNPRFALVVPMPMRQRLKQRLLDAQSKGNSLEIEREKAAAEKARLADYESYLEAVTEVRKNITKSVVNEMNSKGLSYDSETDPVRLLIIQQIESFMRPKVYESAPKTLTAAQLDNIWKEIQGQIRSNL